MKVEYHLLLLTFVFIAILIPHIDCRQIQVPSITSKNEIDIKLGALNLIQYPKQGFQNIYSRGVRQVVGNKYEEFKPCRQNGPQVQLLLDDDVIFTGVPKKPLIIYNFEDIRYSQFLLDIYNDGKDIYIMFQNGMMAYIQLKSDDQIKQAHVYSVQGLMPQTRLQVGYFTKVSGQILFANSIYAIKVSPEGAQVLQGYQPQKGFQTVISIGSDIFAAAFREKGVKFFSLTGNTIEKIYQITTDSFLIEKTLQISDMAYHSSKKLLLILDEDNGLLKFDISISGKQIQARKFGMLFSRDLCNLIHLNEQKEQVYIVCKYIYQISFAQYPILTQKFLPHPNIKIRQIYTVGPLLAYVGRDLFKLMYLDRLVSYYQDLDMDKILFTDKMFISANEEGLLIGDYKIQQPYISCQTEDQGYLGQHKLELTTVAECNQQFLTSNGISKDKIKGYTAQDKCMYTIYQNVYFWEPGQIFMLPIIIGLVIFIVIALTVLVIWLLKKIRMGAMQRQLDQYLRIGSTGENLDYQKYQDQKGTQQIQMQGKQNGKNANASNASNKNEEDLPENVDNYDIE